MLVKFCITHDQTERMLYFTRDQTEKAKSYYSFVHLCCLSLGNLPAKTLKVRRISLGGAFRLLFLAPSSSLEHTRGHFGFIFGGRALTLGQTHKILFVTSIHRALLFEQSSESSPHPTMKLTFYPSLLSGIFVASTTQISPAQAAQCSGKGVGLYNSDFANGTKVIDITGSYK